MAIYKAVLNESDQFNFNAVEIHCDFTNPRTWETARETEEEGKYKLKCVGAFPYGRTCRISGVAPQENLQNPIFFYDGYRADDDTFEFYIGDGQYGYNGRLRDLTVTIETF